MYFFPSVFRIFKFKNDVFIKILTFFLNFLDFVFEVLENQDDGFFATRIKFLL
jgi:hypothetical protein